MNDPTVALLGFAACAAAVIAPLLVFKWLKRRHPRTYATAVYVIVLALVCFFLTCVIVAILTDLFPADQDSDVAVALFLGPMIVAVSTVARHWRTLVAWADHMQLSFLPRIVAATLLLGAPFRWPDDYFVLLRWFVFGAACLLVVVGWPRRQFVWVWLFAMTALLFNPLRPVHFNNDSVWHAADYLAATLFVSSCWFVSERNRARRRHETAAARQLSLSALDELLGKKIVSYSVYAREQPPASAVMLFNSEAKPLILVFEGLSLRVAPSIGVLRDFVEVESGEWKHDRLDAVRSLYLSLWTKATNSSSDYDKQQWLTLGRELGVD